MNKLSQVLCQRLDLTVKFFDPRSIQCKVATMHVVHQVLHQLRQRGKLVDRVYVIASGASVTHGSYAEVMAHPDVIEKYLGTAVAPAVEA